MAMVCMALKKIQQFMSSLVAWWSSTATAVAQIAAVTRVGSLAQEFLPAVGPKYAIGFFLRSLPLRGKGRKVLIDWVGQSFPLWPLGGSRTQSLRAHCVYLCVLGREIGLGGNTSGILEPWRTFQYWVKRKVIPYFVLSHRFTQHKDTGTVASGTKN